MKVCPYDAEFCRFFIKGSGECLLPEPCDGFVGHQERKEGDLKIL